MGSDEMDCSGRSQGSQGAGATSTPMASRSVDEASPACTPIARKRKGAEAVASSVSTRSSARKRARPSTASSVGASESTIVSVSKRRLYSAHADRLELRPPSDEQASFLEPAAARPSRPNGASAAKYELRRKGDGAAAAAASNGLVGVESASEARRRFGELLHGEASTSAKPRPTEAEDEDDDDGWTDDPFALSDGPALKTAKAKRELKQKKAKPAKKANDSQKKTKPAKKANESRIKAKPAKKANDSQKMTAAKSAKKSNDSQKKIAPKPPKKANDSRKKAAAEPAKKADDSQKKAAAKPTKKSNDSRSKAKPPKKSNESQKKAAAKPAKRSNDSQKKAATPKAAKKANDSQKKKASPKRAVKPTKKANDSQKKKASPEKPTKSINRSQKKTTPKVSSKTKTTADANRSQENRSKAKGIMTHENFLSPKDNIRKSISRTECGRVRKHCACCDGPPSPRYECHRYERGHRENRRTYYVADSPPMMREPHLATPRPIRQNYRWPSERYDHRYEDRRRYEPYPTERAAINYYRPSYDRSVLPLSYGAAPIDRTAIAVRRERDVRPSSDMTIATLAPNYLDLTMSTNDAFFGGPSHRNGHRRPVEYPRRPRADNDVRMEKWTDISRISNVVSVREENGRFINTSRFSVFKPVSQRDISTTRHTTVRQYPFEEPSMDNRSICSFAKKSLLIDGHSRNVPSLASDPSYRAVSANRVQQFDAKSNKNAIDDFGRYPHSTLLRDGGDLQNNNKTTASSSAADRYRKNLQNYHEAPARRTEQNVGRESDDFEANLEMSEDENDCTVINVDNRSSKRTPNSRKNEIRSGKNSNQNCVPIAVPAPVVHPAEDDSPSPILGRSQKFATNPLNFTNKNAAVQSPRNICKSLSKELEFSKKRTAHVDEAHSKEPNSASTLDDSWVSIKGTPLNSSIWKF